MNFKTTITAQAGAKKYILHDTMYNSLTFNKDVKVTYNGITLNDPADYTVATPGDDGCTFDVTFKDRFLNRLGANDKIEVTYSATVNDNAVVKNPMKNTTHLTYGDKTTETSKSETTTKTFGIPVFKYTGNDQALKGAKFILSTDPQCKDDSQTLKFKINNDNKYRYDKTGTATLESLSTGRIDIEGLKAGTYYLKETVAPEGYNVLKDIQTIEITEDGEVKLKGKVCDEVKVKNNSGTLLPSTGGMGTTMIYLVGAVLVLGSGIVLASKRRANSK